MDLNRKLFYNFIFCVKLIIFFSKKLKVFSIMIGLFLFGLVSIFINILFKNTLQNEYV